MGTSVGAYKENLIGAAPGAKWIACRAIGTGSKRDRYLRWFVFA